MAPTPPRADLYDNAASRIRYEAFARLQSTACAFGESLAIPEIVAIGGQSDGKSSLLEALLGFRFNITSSEMGTRRPLIVQMTHDPAAQAPRCQLQDEEGDAYGEPLPEGAIAEALRDRAEAHLRRLGAPVSAKPMVMKVAFAFCPNLTIIDTPGFILKARAGEAESTPDDIRAMVKAQCAPPHRLILFLQQSSVEWCSSLWTGVVQEVDPEFRRTVMVASKFDNRVKELGERWELEKYLSAQGYLPPSVKPFFVALPKDRAHASSAEWRAAIQRVDAGVRAHLRGAVEGGFDEERFGPRIGFGNLKRFLEEELAARYRDAAPATLAVLQERCAAVGADLEAAEARLRRAGDVAALRRAALEHALSVAARVQGVLRGFGGADPARFGLTTDEERAAAGGAGAGGWPGAGGAEVRPPNAGLRLFGGAAFERCLQEFQCAAEAVTFPPVPRDRVANMLLAQRGRGDGAGAGARAAEELACAAARAALGPLLEAACARLAGVVRRAYGIAAELEAGAAGGDAASAAAEALRPYVAFHAALRSAFQGFAQGMEERGRELVRHHLETATGHFAAAALLEGGEGAGEREVCWAISAAAAGGPGDEEAAGAGAGAGGDGDAGGHHTPAPASALENRAPAGRAGRRAADAAPAPTERQPFLSTQMAIPETPSPELTATGAKGDAPLGRRVHALAAAAAGGAGRDLDAGSPGKGRVAKAARVGGLALGDDHAEVCARAARLFARIKRSVAAQAAPATLKAAFLEPVAARLAAELCVQTAGRADEEFLGLFATKSALAALGKERDALARRRSGLARMTAEFGELARAL